MDIDRRDAEGTEGIKKRLMYILRLGAEEVYSI